MRVFLYRRLGEALSDSEIEKSEHSKKSKAKRVKREGQMRRRHNSTSETTSTANKSSPRTTDDLDGSKVVTPLKQVHQFIIKMSMHA